MLNSWYSWKYSHHTSWKGWRRSGYLVALVDYSGSTVVLLSPDPRSVRESVGECLLDNRACFQRCQDSLSANMDGPMLCGLNLANTKILVTCGTAKTDCARPLNSSCALDTRQWAN